MFLASSSSADQSKALVKFSKHWDINQAYQHLTSSVGSVVVQSGDLPQLQRACIQKIKGVGSNLPRKLIPQIESTSSVNGLLDTLTKSEYWNWFDTRLLEAVTHASGSREAIKLFDHFRKTFYQRKVSDLILYNVEIKPFEKFITLVEKYDKDPSKLTIADLQKHQYELEQVLEGGLVLVTIKTGCIELTWQVPQELVYRAYTSMKRKQDKLSSLAVKSLVCEAADQYAGLPFVWRGQEVGEVGPIEPLLEHVRQEPYSLPQGFQWVTLSSSDTEEVVNILLKTQRAIFSFAAFYFIIKNPHTKSEWQFGIRASNGKLVGVVLGHPLCMSIGGVSVKCVYPTMKFHYKYHNKRIFYMAFKELQRRTNLNNINQFLIDGTISFLKPLTTCTMWYYDFILPTSYQLPTSPRTPGWRIMKPNDVPNALAFVNKYSSQFEVRQVFTSKEEFSHWFLCPAVPNFVLTYVVENETDITDLVRCSLDDNNGKPVVFVHVVISTVTPVKQLLLDVMVCARDTGAVRLTVIQRNINSETLLSLSLKPTLYIDCYFYHYKYHEVPEANYFDTL